jgi:hypothetical protein
MAWDFASNRPSPRGVDLTQQAEGFFTPDGRCISVAFTPGYLGLAPDDERKGCTIRRVKISPGEIVKGNAGVAIPAAPEPLQEPVTIAKALRAHREARPVVDGGGTGKACVMLVNIQLRGWCFTPEQAANYADGYNHALRDMRSAYGVKTVDGGQQ